MFSLRFSRALYGRCSATASARGSCTWGDLPRFNSSILLQRLIQLADVIAQLLVRNVVVGDLTAITVEFFFIL